MSDLPYLIGPIVFGLAVWWYAATGYLPKNWRFT